MRRNNLLVLGFKESIVHRFRPDLINLIHPFTYRMKNLIIFFLLLPVFLSAQTIQSAGYNTTGYIKPDGTIQNRSYSTVGYIKSNGTIQNASYSTIGYIKSDGTIQNSSYSVVGYVKKDGTVQNSSYSTVGFVKEDGTVQDKSYATLGYARGVKKEWAAVVFFFFKFPD